MLIGWPILASGATALAESGHRRRACPRSRHGEATGRPGQGCPVPSLAACPVPGSGLSCANRPARSPPPGGAADAPHPPVERVAATPAGSRGSVAVGSANGDTSVVSTSPSASNPARPNASTNPTRSTTTTVPQGPRSGGQHDAERSLMVEHAGTIHPTMIRRMPGDLGRHVADRAGGHHHGVGLQGQHRVGRGGLVGSQRHSTPLAFGGTPRHKPGQLTSPGQPACKVDTPAGERLAFQQGDPMAASGRHPRCLQAPPDPPQRPPLRPTSVLNMVPRPRVASRPTTGLVAQVTGSPRTALP